MRLVAESLTLGYRGREVLRDVSLSIAPGEFVAIVGPNASGKSTLLRAIGRAHRPQRGRVTLDGDDLYRLPPREVARRLALLPQLMETEIDLTVEELAWRGRLPHQRMLRPTTDRDAQVVEEALRATDSWELRARPLGALSGGERQRAWIALALAQEPRVLLLDEPTTFLDLRHQLEVMETLRALRAGGLSVVCVLHDLALGARYADRLIGIARGGIAFDGPPAEALDADVLSDVFGVPMDVLTDPATGRLVPVPR